MTFLQAMIWFFDLIHLEFYCRFLVLLLFTFVGGIIFMCLEQENDLMESIHLSEKVHLVINETGNTLIGIYENATWTNSSFTVFNRTIEQLHSLLVTMNLTDYNNKPTNPWILTGSMFYSMQLYTTIGYGSPTPKTNKGRGFTIFYCIVGIPSFLWYIRSVGKYLSKTMKKMYKKLRNSPVGKLPFLKTIMSAVDKFENGGVSEEEETKKPLPIIVAVIMIVFWIVLSAYLFSEWEGTWDFWSAIYFCFISNATVGLGDMLFTSSHMIPVNSVFILVGLALLSMTFDLVTNKVSTLVKRTVADYKQQIAEIKDQVLMSPQLTYFAATNQKNYQPGFQDMLKKWMARQVFETVVLPEILESDDESDSDDESEFMSQEQEAFRRLVESMPEYSSGDFNNCIFLEFVKHRKLPRFFKNTMTNQTTIACQTGEQDDRADNDTLFPDDEYFKSDSHNIFSQYDHESINSLFDDIPLD